MKALKCDICGGYFDSVSTRRSISKHTKPNYVRLDVMCDNCNYVTASAFDICPDCYAAIKKTIDARRKTVDPMEDDLK